MPLAAASTRGLRRPRPPAVPPTRTHSCCRCSRNMTLPACPCPRSADSNDFFDQVQPTRFLLNKFFVLHAEREAEATAAREAAKAAAAAAAAACLQG